MINLAFKKRKHTFALNSIINMIGVITGDIVNSQKVDPKSWIKRLKLALSVYGETPKQWEIFRGDSFQIEINDPSSTLEVAILVKSSVKMIKGMDAHMAIGIGEKNYTADKITECNGSAFVYSSESAETVKKQKINLVVRSDSAVFDRDMNLYFKLASKTMDKWSVSTAEMVYTTMQNLNLSQKELGVLLRIKQNAVSGRLKRAQYDDSLELIHLYHNKIKEML